MPSLAPISLLVPADRVTESVAWAEGAARGLRARGVAAEVIRLEGRWPCPDADALDAAELRLMRAAEGARVWVDALLWQGLGGTLRSLSQRRWIGALAHVPLERWGTDWSDAERALARADEREALSRAREILTPSEADRQALCGRLGIDPARVTAAPPGVEPRRRPAPKGSPPGPEDRPGAIVCPAELEPAEGQLDLVRAFADAGAAGWRLVLAGRRSDPAYARQVEEEIQRLGLRASVVETPEAIEEALRGAAFIASAAAAPSWRVALLDGIARGLPVLTTDAAARGLPRGPTASAPGGARGPWTAALRWLTRSPAVRAAMASEAIECAEHLPTWADACAPLLRTTGAPRR